ncbi:response regulator [Yoonia sp. BS5-3]|uniref:Response regulator transcription factor n=1 Tax=Yoonia phaeophyticola TaxID=3137369 RepID=A0ABZ2V631_9RHOB
MPRILLMDDDMPLALEVAGALRKEGHEVVVTNTATDARDELWHWDFDLLITDIVVRKSGRPVADGGFGLISWVRQQQIATPELTHLPIIAISGAASHPALQFILPTADRIGADVVLEKPFDMVQIIAEIDRLCSVPKAQG